MFNLDEGEFVKEELVYLGFVILRDNLQMDPSMVEAILNWTILRNVGDVTSFNGLTTFYWKFIKNFSQICVVTLDALKGGNKGSFLG